MYTSIVEFSKTSGDDEGGQHAGHDYTTAAPVQRRKKCDQVIMRKRRRSSAENIIRTIVDARECALTSVRPYHRQRPGHSELFTGLQESSSSGRQDKHGESYIPGGI